jgi:1,4-dihydroxy-2-naphthoate octaprenyltransferase
MSKNIWEGINLAGVRFWTASLLPAFVGTTLPFWLRPPNFTFRLFAAIEFLLATVLFHAGFSFILAWFEGNHTENWSKERILVSAGLCISLSCLIGFHINANLQLSSNVYEGIFLVYGFCALFVGVLYVVPPINFYRQVCGEIVITYSLGLLPILGAYIVQVGDITRTVYLAALPVIVITGLWVWINEMTDYSIREKSERKTMVTYFGIRFSGRFGVFSISILYFLTLLLAVYSASVNPLALVSLLFVVPMWKIVNKTWNNYSVLEQMRHARNNAAVLHFTTCVIIALSSLIVWISIPIPALSW